VHPAPNLTPALTLTLTRTLALALTVTLTLALTLALTVTVTLALALALALTLTLPQHRSHLHMYAASLCPQSSRARIRIAGEQYTTHAAKASHDTCRMWLDLEGILRIAFEAWKAVMSSSTRSSTPFIFRSTFKYAGTVY
jgi:hypothetical protein